VKWNNNRAPLSRPKRVEPARWVMFAVLAAGTLALLLSAGLQIASLSAESPAPTQTAAQPGASDLPTSEPEVSLAQDAVASAEQPTAVAQTVACGRFLLKSDAKALDAETQTAIKACLARAMRATPEARIRIRASAAWPGPAGKYSVSDIETFASSRGKLAKTYLDSLGIAATQIQVETVLPPAEHRETSDRARQAQDRYIEVFVVAGQ
jgi:hypothetical protein